MHEKYSNAYIDTDILDLNKILFNLQVLLALPEMHILSLISLILVSGVTV